MKNLFIAIVIFLSIYFNNCSSTKDLDPIINFKCTPEKIFKGDSALLSWSIFPPGASKISVQNIGDNLSQIGAKSVSPLKSQTYILNIEREGKSPFQSKANLEIIEPKIKFDIIPPTITEGESAKVTWSINDYGKCSIIINEIGDSLNTEGFESVSPKSTKQYTLKILKPGLLPIEMSKSLEVKKKEYKRNSNGSKIPDFPVLSNYLKGQAPKNKIQPNSNIDLTINRIVTKYFPDSIILYVTLKDEYGNFISNLAAPYAENQDEYKNVFLPFDERISPKEAKCKDSEMKVTEFSVTEYHEADAEPHTLALSLDYSGSMFNNITNLENASKTLFNLWKKYGKDQISIVKWDHRVLNLVKPTRNIMEIYNNFDNYGFSFLGGFTALYDGALEGMKNLAQSNNSKILLLFTDGFENASFPTIAMDVINFARDNKITIYPVGFSNSPEGVDEQLLKLLAECTGGKYYFAPESEAEEVIKDIFTEIFLFSKVYYKILYKPIKDCEEEEHRVLLLANHIFKKDSVIKSTASYFPPKAKINYFEPKRTYHVSFYEFNKWDINPNFFAHIDKFANYMKNNSNVKLEIIGHTDTKGPEAYNKELGQKRADEVKEYFIKKGIDKEKLKAYSEGKSHPLNYPDDEDYKSQENRRVEVKVIR